MPESQKWERGALAKVKYEPESCNKAVLTLLWDL